MLTITAYAVERSLPPPSQYLRIMIPCWRLCSSISRTPALQHRALLAFAVCAFSLRMKTLTLTQFAPIKLVQGRTAFLKHKLAHYS